MRKPILTVSLLLIIAALQVAVYAHAGGTDSEGGHHDHSTGEYHYHHGYPAHDHYDMDGDGDIDCPYEFKDKTSINSGSSSNSSGDFSSSEKANTKQSSNSKRSDIIVKIAISIMCFLCAFPFMISVIFWTTQKIFKHIAFRFSKAAVRENTIWGFAVILDVLITGLLIWLLIW